MPPKSNKNSYNIKIHSKLQLLMQDLTIINNVADFFTSSCPKLVFASVRPFKPLSKAVKTFICTASCRELFACLMHSAKWSSICNLCLFATRGNICPNSDTDMSITATPSGNGPGKISPYQQTSTISFLYFKRTKLFLPPKLGDTSNKDHVPTHPNLQHCLVATEIHKSVISIETIKQNQGLIGKQN